MRQSAMGVANRSRVATWLVHATWLVGCALLLSYAGVRFWIERSNEAALAAFHLERSADAARARPEPAQVPAVPAARSLLDTGLAIEAPDTTTWSRQRAAAYRSARGTSASVLAVLHIKAVELEVPVYEGATQWNLNLGAAWIEGTAPFGAGGNTAVAGHRDGYFRALRKLSVGDVIEVETLSGLIRYHVTQIRIVSPHAVEVLNPRAVPTLTLVTCYPFHHVGSAPKRWIAHAERIDDVRGSPSDT